MIGNHSVTCEQRLNEAKSKDVDATIGRVRDMEAALATALDQVEAASLSNIEALDVSQEEAARVRERLAEQESDLEQLVAELSQARSQLSNASTASAAAEVCVCVCHWPHLCTDRMCKHFELLLLVSFKHR
jgi:chromosome segregation ATPase